MISKESKNDDELRNLVRVLKLNNLDIFHVWTVDRNFQYEDCLFYEVIEIGLDQFRQPKWERNGVVFTINEVNELYKTQ